MKKSMLLLASVLFSLSVLTACNMGTNDADNGPEDVNYRPVRYDRDLDRDMNRGLDIDTDPRDVKQPGERDTPFNMDEEEPDLDEEPSEERRGR
ncbi:hypothetical protein FIU87_10340 [Bacillus sp. THAF10]|uniref:hypothetical protein n=1 Tax=Bacillus sp. THAF10 TaxID=2587848 RepID=UPI00126967F0|nr:hypothetical protein [Bacillus sp. THAF10]QFT89045.1 hypothetical protein FIU87_10340 [Bacillus sp. THAF10]